ncbi:MAG: hypothetical protein KGH79_04140 [Patescibacteria group bacterium]|nr:hypothetical protein [Patescibacteria group bacterium]
MIAHAFITVFKDWKYVLLSAVVAAIAFALATWLPNLQLLYSILKDPLVPLADKVMLPINLLGSIATNFTTLAASYTIAIALLIGINIALTTYQVSRQRQGFSKGGAATSSLGVLTGIFGIGCAACNSLVLMSALGVVGGAGIIPLLPLKGGEFGIAGVLLLGTATYLLARQVTKPLVC